MVTYHTHAQIVQMYKDLCDLYPEWCSYEVLGKTYNDNDIWMFRIGTSGATNKVMIDSSLHGWEDILSEATYLFLDWLLKSEEPRAIELLNRNYLLLVPVVNYDSNDRGNANYEECPTYGVDLNRNFIKNWSAAACGDGPYGTSTGDHAGSEPETQVMQLAYTNLQPSVYINGHYGGGPVLYYYANNSQYINFSRRVDETTRALNTYNYPRANSTVGGGACGGAYQSGCLIPFNLETYSRNIGEPGWGKSGEPSYNCPYNQLIEWVYPAVKSIIFAACEYCQIIPTSNSWYNTDWQYRKKITINDTYVTGSHFYFPFYYRLSGIVDKITSDAHDIIFTNDDGVTRIPHDVDTYSQGTGSIWINIPSLVDGTEKSIYMYYGNLTCDDQLSIDGYLPSSVWNKYIYVSHMNDYEDTLHIKDSSKYENHSKKRIDNKPYMCHTILGSGQFFKISDDTFISSSSIPEYNVSSNYFKQFSVSCWINKGTSPNGGYIFSKLSSNVCNPVLSLSTDSSTTTTINAMVSTNNTTTTVSPTSFSNDTDYYIAVAYASTSRYIRTFKNGSQTSSSFGYYGHLLSSNANIYIGNKQDLTQPFSGSIDELRVTNSVQIPGWYLMEYNNVIYGGNGFYTLGDEEEGEQEAEQPSSIIKKMQIHYTTVSSSGYDFLANTFDLIDCGRSQESAIAAIKEINPDLEAIGYFDSILLPDFYDEYTVANDGSHEHWFLHTKSGSTSQYRLSALVASTPVYHNYVMNYDPDVTPNPNWSQYYASKNVWTVSGTNFNGIFCDDVFKWIDRDSASFYQFSSGGWKVNIDNLDSDVLDGWSEHCICNFISAQHEMDTRIPSSNQRMLMLNAWKWTDVAYSSTRCHFWEGFIHGRSTAITNMGYGSGYDYGRLPITLLHNLAKSGCKIAVNCGTLSADTYPELVNRWQVFTLACFMFCVSSLSDAYYSWQFSSTDSSHGYFSEMDTEFGIPIDNDYIQYESTMVYYREFSNYYVIANLSVDTNYDVTIGDTDLYMISRNGYFLEKESSDTDSFVSNMFIGQGSINFMYADRLLGFIRQ